MLRMLTAKHLLMSGVFQRKKKSGETKLHMNLPINHHKK